MGLPLRSCPILLITRMIKDRIGLHSVLFPLLIINITISLNVIGKLTDLFFTNYFAELWSDSWL